MDVLALHASRQPDRPALLDDRRTLTWREMVERRNRVAHGLLRLGVERGQHVAVYGENSIEVMLASAAARAVGAIAVPVNHRLGADEVAYVLDDSDAALVFVGDHFLATVETVRTAATNVRHWVTLGAERRPWADHFADLVVAGDPGPVPVDVGTNVGGSMIYTAGTTGHPKGALRRAVDPRSVIPRFEVFGLVDPSHVHLAAGPLYHSAPGAFALYTHVFGGTVVVMPRFDAEAALAATARHRCTSTFMAPTLLKRIVDLPAAVRARYDVSSMRVIVMAAAPCPMRVKEQVLEYFGPVLHEFYGSTELGVNTVLRPEDVLRKPHSCGRAAPGVELGIFDDAGAPVPAGTPGELFVRHYDGVFDEYWKKPDATRDTRRGEWLSVGDVAWIDDDGFVYICDRKRDMIISGGVNIYPAEIEDALHRHPAIDDVAVFGIPDDEWGEKVHAAVQPSPDATLTEDDVVAFARQRLGGYKVPRSISFHAALPRDSAGKLVKRVLREPYWAGRATRV
ncbi:MAG: AMP-binding protein [Candidatus Rokubacteria bacterium]|nr:AMP-binding protein [Candidatus Rokubacteria bacterium]